jgi:hypothetical protein
MLVQFLSTCNIGAEVGRRNDDSRCSSCSRQEASVGLNVHPKIGMAQKAEMTVIGTVDCVTAGLCLVAEIGKPSQGRSSTRQASSLAVGLPLVACSLFVVAPPLFRATSFSIHDRRRHHGILPARATFSSSRSCACSSSPISRSRSSSILLRSVISRVKHRV